MGDPRSLTERLERLVKASNQVGSGTPLPEVLQWIAEFSRDLIGARYAAIGLLSPDNRTLESFTTSGITMEERDLIGHPPTGRGVLGLVIQDSVPVRVAALGEHPRSVGFPPNHPPMQSFLGVPVMGRHGVLGNLYFTDKIGAEEFSAEDEHLAILLSGKAATAVEDARRLAETARLMSEVQALLRSRERFFAMVNHELRNSLAAVFGWAEMLVRRKDPATVPQAAFEVVESAESAISLINDLLDLSRLDEDRLKPVLQAVDCATVVHRALSRVTPAAEEREIILNTSFPDVLVTCHTDSSRVEQILVNVLVNAIRHTARSSTVSLAIEIEDDQACFTVQDEGPGIPPENLESIFDVYITSPGEEGAGLGLGLPLSRRLARLLGGDLTAANGSRGGAAFTLRLPLPSHAS
jgi:signal transduction histidine kinase